MPNRDTAPVKSSRISSVKYNTWYNTWIPTARTAGVQLEVEWQKPSGGTFREILTSVDDGSWRNAKNEYGTISNNIPKQWRVVN